MFFGSQNVERLFDQAMEDVEQGRFEPALEKARKLRKGRFSGAFEVEARVYLAKKQPERALESLREAPEQVFILQLMLATTLSDLGQYPEAFEVYARARKCPQADATALDYNEAVTLMLSGRIQEALRLCPAATGELAIPCLALRATLLSQTGDHAGAAALAGSALECEPPEQEAAAFWQALAAAAWHLRRAKGEAMEAAERALCLNNLFEAPVELLRQIDSCSSQRFFLTIRGIWHEKVDGQVMHFFRMLHLEAPTLDDALHFARQQEPLEVRESMALEEVQELGAYPAGRGLLWSSGHLFFPPE